MNITVTYRWDSVIFSISHLCAYYRAAALHHHNLTVLKVNSECIKNVDMVKLYHKSQHIYGIIIKCYTSAVYHLESTSTAALIKIHQSDLFRTLDFDNMLDPNVQRKELFNEKCSTKTLWSACAFESHMLGFYMVWCQTWRLVADADCSWSFFVVFFCHISRLLCGPQKGSWRFYGYKLMRLKYEIHLCFHL